MAQQHGAVGGRVTGEGNTSAEEIERQRKLGDPAEDLIGTFRRQPTPLWERDWDRMCDLNTPRVVRVSDDSFYYSWAVIDPRNRLGGRALLSNEEVEDWPVCDGMEIGWAQRMERHRLRGGAVPEPHAEPVRPVEGEEEERLFRG